MAATTLITGRWSLDQRHVLLAVTWAVLALLVLVPLLVLLLSTVQPGAIVTMPPREWSLEHYRTVFLDGVTYRLLLNTLGYALGSVLVALLPALILSWLVGRTDLPFRGAFHGLALASFAIPSLITAFGWILLASPRSGALNVLWRNLSGSKEMEGPLNVYTLPGMVLVTGIALVPSVFTFLVTMFERMDPSLEEAAATSGANAAATARRITLPLLLPGIATALVFYLVVLIQTFEIPLAIGLSAGIPVLSTRIFLLTQPESGLLQYGLAATFSLIALGTGFALLLAYSYVTRLDQRFQIVTGKGYRPRRRHLRAWKYPALLFAGTLVTVQLFLPLCILIWTALLPFYQPPSLTALQAVSLDTFRNVLAKPRVLQALGNTAVLVLVAATVTILLASLTAWLAQRSRIRGAGLLDQMAFLPSSIPTVVVGLALLLLFIRTPAYGTIWIVALGHVIHFLPFGVRLMGGAILQISRELEEAAAVSGTTPLGTFRYVVLPLILPALVNGWIWVFAHSLRDFTFPLMLRATGNVVIATMIWELWSQPDTPGAAALSVILVLCVGLIALLIRGLLGQNRTSAAEAEPLQRREGRS